MRFLKLAWAYIHALLTGRNYGRLQFDEQFFTPDRRFQFLSPGSSPLWRAMVFGIWLYPFTVGGKALIAGFSLAFLIGAVSVEVPMYQIFIALLALIVVTSAMGSMFRWAKLEVTGGFPARITVGQILTGHFSVANKGWMPVYDVSAGCFLPPRGWEVHKLPLMIPHLPSGI
ncbi:MAG: hypothetical protein JWM11_7184, partial [Planctomycetaceae bacterium]|nr:hypothetical protein [Planctomycetaceae bacterium]